MVREGLEGPEGAVDFQALVASRAPVSIKLSARSKVEMAVKEAMVVAEVGARAVKVERASTSMFITPRVKLALMRRST